MKRFNLSEWAITHRALVLFMILLIGGAGLYSYFNLAAPRTRPSPSRPWW
jgi:multidrug efflux pump subunit AcrB